MFGEKHDLVHELPEYRELIHKLKAGNQHFARLFEHYHDIDDEIRRIEQGIETPSDDYTETLKKLRLQLKDELLAILREQQNL